MIDKEQLDYTVDKIRQSKGLFQLSNDPLADEMLPYIQQIMPGVGLVKYGIYQWFIMNGRGKGHLLKELVQLKKDTEKELRDLEKAIAELKALQNEETPAAGTARGSKIKK